MACRFCNSDNHYKFRSEINIHFPNILEKSVFAFPELLICLDCGSIEGILTAENVQSLRAESATDSEDDVKTGT
jgi:hypothetical protein